MSCISKKSETEADAFDVQENLKALNTRNKTDDSFKYRHPFFFVTFVLFQLDLGLYIKINS